MRGRKGREYGEREMPEGTERGRRREAKRACNRARPRSRARARGHYLAHAFPARSILRLSPRRSRLLLTALVYSSPLPFVLDSLRPCLSPCLSVPLLRRSFPSDPSFALVPCPSKLCRLSWPGAHAARRGRFTGTRIVYDKSALLHLKHSPLARTPPRTMPHIPGVTHAAPGAEVVTAAAVPSDHHHHHHEHGVPAAKPAAATAPAPAASGGTHGLRRRLSPTRTS